MKTKFITILSIIAILTIVLLGISYPEIRTNKIVIMSLVVLALFPVAVYFINVKTATGDEADNVFEKLAGEQEEKPLTITCVKPTHKEDKNEVSVEVKFKDGSVGTYYAPETFPSNGVLTDRISVLISSNSFTGRITAIKNKVKKFINSFTPVTAGHAEYGYVYCFYKNNEMLLSDIKKVLVDYFGFQPVSVDGKIVNYSLDLEIPNKKISKYAVATEFDTSRSIVLSVWLDILSKIKTLPEFHVTMPMSQTNNELFLSVLAKEKLTMEEFVKLTNEEMAAVIKKVVNSNKFVNDLHVTLQVDVNEVELPEEPWYFLDSNEYFEQLVTMILAKVKPNVHFLYTNKNGENIFHRVEIKKYLIGHRE